jgi:hypothetical protein
VGGSISGDAGTGVLLLANAEAGAAVPTPAPMLVAKPMVLKFLSISRRFILDYCNRLTERMCGDNQEEQKALKNVTNAITLSRQAITASKN